MGLFDKIFKGNRKPSELEDVNTNEYILPEFSDYKFVPADSNELESFEKYAEYIKTFMPMYIKDLNTEHIFHPDNIIRLWDAWIIKPELQRFPPVNEPQFIDYLSTCIGMYIRDKYNLIWCYAANLKTSQNGNLNAEAALINERLESEIFFLPLQVLRFELCNKRGVLASEINRLEDLIKKKPKSKELSLQDFVAYAKSTGKGEDVVKVWDYILSLKELHFLSVYEEDVQKCRPFIGVINEKPWFFVFTDKDKAIKYAKTDNKFQSKNGDTLVISQPTEKSLQMIIESESNGVYGVMVNESDKDVNADFNAPISVLKRIIQIIKN